ncbi:hypothetical protein [Streptomyces sp. NBC_01310]|uniref:hypothetical protein n=1 Tax=Streptomyces sp. NBC_01310 TaxID=2903820 RepID=UPI0035B5A2F0
METDAGHTAHPAAKFLTDAHQDAVTGLTRLADPWLLRGVVRILPVALDRHALTLRCEYARQHLLVAARACPRRRHLPARP